MKIDKRGTRHIKITLGYAETRACEADDSTGARAGREYRANELKRDADAAHARVEGHMLDRQ